MHLRTGYLRPSLSPQARSKPFGGKPSLSDRYSSQAPPSTTGRYDFKSKGQSPRVRTRPTRNADAPAVRGRRRETTENSVQNNLGYQPHQVAVDAGVPTQASECDARAVTITFEICTDAQLQLLERRADRDSRVWYSAPLHFCVCRGRTKITVTSRSSVHTSGDE